MVFAASKLLQAMILWCLIVSISEAILYEGECLSAYNCSWALERIKRRQHTEMCSFIGKIPIVCCPNQKSEEASSSVNISEMQNSHQNIYTKEGNYGKLSQEICEEFYPHQNPLILNVATGGTKSLPEEFPHMAILGFGESNDKQWKCGGSLITLQHILTAAHCVYSRDFGDVKYVRLGDLDIESSKDRAEPQDFTVRKAIRHPNFESSTVSNDIAILELDRPATLTKYVKPACLHLGGKISSNDQITATGWGATAFTGDFSSHLIKVRLLIVQDDDCRKQFLNTGRKGKIDNNKQICAASADNSKIMDTCQGDSGGPLQVKNYTNRQHFNIIGITSFGKACGITNSAGIYTRVSHFVPWIEDVISQT